MGAIAETVERIAGVLDVRVRYSARLARNDELPTANSLPFMPASSVRPGMVMVDEHGDFDVVTDVEWVQIDEPVYDLDIDRTHNFVANGIVTHNSIYKFRGADFRNLLKFEEAVPRGGHGRARPELPVDAAHPRRRERGDREQRVAPAEASLDRQGRGRADRPLPGRRRARRSRVRRARDPSPRSTAATIATATSRSSTAPTRRAACSKSRWCVRACRTACSAA